MNQEESKRTYKQLEDENVRLRELLKKKTEALKGSCEEIATLEEELRAFYIMFEKYEALEAKNQEYKAELAKAYDFIEDQDILIALLKGSIAALSSEVKNLKSRLYNVLVMRRRKQRMEVRKC